ncbi:hypothetical protein CYMTET_29079 [Cymbomonas tetramitiformis]|uniref:Uncharacterized protein n=1 Tax=Cymbomonas tetramitiformis TaxID=36881 RepID=A0AAE0FLQ6_9CHLO|nr:hypothetical protein CYMTET_29079 [Cymbomonas tetramitiformis]
MTSKIAPRLRGILYCPKPFSQLKRSSLNIQAVKKERGPTTYEVRLVTPPPKSLGLHPLPYNTQNGEVVNVKGQEFVVCGVCYQYKLCRGKYRKDNTRLDVLTPSRYILNLHLDGLFDSDESPEH